MIGFPEQELLRRRIVRRGDVERHAHIATDGVPDRCSDPLDKPVQGVSRL